MPDDIDTTEAATTTDDSAGEPVEPSPTDDPSSAESPAEETAEEVELTPEQQAEKEKEARRAARVKAADAAEHKAAAARKKRQQDREYSEREERVRAREQEANAARQRAHDLIQELEQRKSAILKGGYDGLKAVGVDYGDWTKKTLEDTSPDALARQAIEEARQLRAELQRRDQEAAQERQQRAAEAEAKRLETMIEDSADDFPDAAALTSRMTHVLAQEAAQDYRRKHGAWPSFTALLPLLDKKAKEFHDEQKTKAAKRSQPTDTPSDGATNPQAKKPGQPASSPANRTLTPATATTKAKAPRAMTPEEEDEWALNELRQAMKADKQPADV